jgi:uncharacterized membrane protein
MADKEKTTGDYKKHVMILSVIGIVLVIAGILIVSVHGNPLRGSGLGTIAIILGIIMLVIAGLRYYRKKG